MSEPLARRAVPQTTATGEIPAFPARGARLRAELKEWGEIADLWSKVLARCGFAIFGLSTGLSAVAVLEKLIK